MEKDGCKGLKNIPFVLNKTYTQGEENLLVPARKGCAIVICACGRHYKYIKIKTEKP